MSIEEYIKNNKTFWIAFQKNIPNLKNLLEYLNNSNTLGLQIHCEFTVCADPFLFTYNNETYLFYEKLNNKKIGEIYMIKISFANNTYIRSEPMNIITTTHHLSYPYVFKNNNKIYMVPEQASSEKLSIYSCDAFPDRWRENVILTGKYYDSTVFKHNNYYWLITSRKFRFGKILEIYYSKNLLSDWKKYEDRIYRNCKCVFNRCGGGIIRENGNLYLPVQIKEPIYGQTLHIERIAELSPNRVRFEHYFTLSNGIHHISRNNDFVAVDFNNLKTS